jgi:hypothetical protein
VLTGFPGTLLAVSLLTLAGTGLLMLAALATLVIGGISMLLLTHVGGFVVRITSLLLACHHEFSCCAAASIHSRSNALTCIETQ